VVAELRAEIVAAYREAIETGSPDALRRADAAERLLSRVYGKPREHVEHIVRRPESEDEIERMSEAELAAYLASMRCLKVVGA